MDVQATYDWVGLRRLCRTLRSPGGCSWDRAQTLPTLTPYLLEETHELLEALANGDDRAAAEELGDLLYLIVFVVTIAEEEGRFDFEVVARGIITKLIRRHPHVFGRPAGDTAGDAAGDVSAAQARASWEQIKRGEASPPEARTAARANARLAAGAQGLPALVEAYRVQEKAAGFGFDWPDVAGVIDKLSEEQGELRDALAARNEEQTHEEVGDLLFTLVNLARHLRGDPEQILKRATRKFQDRFARMESILEREGHALPDTDLPTMESAWQRAKREEG
jgi:MazG family protein